jgi:hypothetical protein
MEHASSSVTGCRVNPAPRPVPQWRRGAGDGPGDGPGSTPRCRPSDVVTSAGEQAIAGHTLVAELIQWEGGMAARVASSAVSCRWSTRETPAEAASKRAGTPRAWTLLPEPHLANVDQETSAGSFRW